MSSPRRGGQPPADLPPTFISDASHLLSPSDLTHLTSLLATLHSHTRAEVTLVTLNSLTPPNPSTSLSNPPPDVRRFALALFNLWGVGDRRDNTGVLVLVVRDARRVEVITGDGAHRLYGLTDDVIQRLLDDGMVPLLRRGEWGRRWWAPWRCSTASSAAAPVVPREPLPAWPAAPP